MLLSDEGCYKKDILSQAVGVIEDTKGKSKVRNRYFLAFQAAER
jgi:hypothetical protein